jgi:uncharacterized OB-fold protein
MSGARPIPVADDPDTGGYFAAAARSLLVTRQCGDCGQVLHLPKAYCHSCGSWNVGWTELRPTGTLHAFTVVERQVHDAFEVPYSIVLVDVDEAVDVRLVGYLPGRHELAIGMPMRVWFERVGDITMPNWQPAISKNDEQGAANVSA